MAKRKSATCIKFNEVPDGTHYREGQYSWVSHATAESYIADGFAIEWNPYEKEPEHVEKPTMDSLKKDIIGYLVEHDIEHDPDKTKSELLELL